MLLRANEENNEPRNGQTIECISSDLLDSLPVCWSVADVFLFLNCPAMNGVIFINDETYREQPGYRSHGKQEEPHFTATASQDRVEPGHDVLRKEMAIGRELNAIKISWFASEEKWRNSITVALADDVSLLDLSNILYLGPMFGYLKHKWSDGITLHPMRVCSRATLITSCNGDMQVLIPWFLRCHGSRRGLYYNALG